jgi:hypothetical protein
METEAADLPFFKGVLSIKQHMGQRRIATGGEGGGGRYTHDKMQVSCKPGVVVEVKMMQAQRSLGMQTL